MILHYVAGSRACWHSTKCWLKWMILLGSVKRLLKNSQVQLYQHYSRLFTTSSRNVKRSDIMVFLPFLDFFILKFLPVWHHASSGTSHALCLLAVTSRSSVNMAEQIELVFGMWAPFYPFFTVLKRNSGISKNKGTSLRHFILNSGLGNFCFGVSIVETCYQ